MSARDDVDDLCQEKRPKDAVRTITDLAGIAGVSAGTVSRALANSSLVKARTRERIQALAREYGFRPNQMASNLRRQKTGVVGVAIPLGHDRHQQVSDSFFMTLLGHLADELTDKGFDLMLRRVIPDRDEDWLDKFIGSGMIDGLIVIGQSDQFERLEDVADGYRPMVVWGNHREGQRHAKAIAFLGDTGPIEFGARFAGAQEAALRLGVPIKAFPTHLSRDVMQGEVAKYLPSLIKDYDGIFAATDTIGVACLHQLTKMGVRLPDQVRLVGFDDLPIASQTNPPLTTIRQDILAGARSMVDLLLRRIAGQTSESVVMPPQLIMRGTA